MVGVVIVFSRAMRPSRYFSCRELPAFSTLLLLA
jgi:hypothetical protein